VVTRRRLLQASAAGAAAFSVKATSAAAAPRPPEGTVRDLGPASVASPLGNGVFVGNVLYAGSRGLSPNVVGTYDLTADAVTGHHEIPTGIGIWAMCSVGTDVYVGTHARSDLYQLDTLTGVTSLVGEYPDHFIWTAAASPDGKVYLGCSEPGRVWEYDPATGTSRDLGQPAPGEQYVRGIAADDDFVYCGIGSNAHLIAIDRVTGAKQDLLPAEVADRDWVSCLSVSQTHIAGGMNSLAEVALLNKSDAADYKIIKATAPGEKYVVVVLLHDGYVYFAGRPSGTFYRAALDTGEVEILGVPYFEALTHRLLVHEGKIYGIQDNAVFVYDPATGSLEYRNLVQRGFRAAAEEPMSMHSDGERVYVGGKSGADIHDLATGDVSRLAIAGEPKSMVTVGDTTYLGVYTQAALYSHRAGEPEATLLARTGHHQDRPREVGYDRRTGLVIVPTQPEPGHINGALSFYSPRAGTYETLRPAVERQTVYAIEPHAGIAYLGTTTQEGLDLPPATPTARVAAFDLTKRRLLWQLEPFAKVRTISSLSLVGSYLYGLASNGEVFEIDVRRRRVTRTMSVGIKGGDLYAIGRVGYCTDGNTIFRLDLNAFTARPIVEDLAGEWFGGEPKLALDPSGRSLFSLRGRSLIEVTITPERER
jgi:outer membrane protein assembly factor BamB